LAWSLTEIGRIEVMVVCDQGMLPKSHSRLGRKRLGIPRQVPRPWQASLRQDLYLVVTGSVLGSLLASLLVVSQLECPVSFFGAASTSTPPYKADPGHLRHCPFWSPFTTRGSVRRWVLWSEVWYCRSEVWSLNMGLLMCTSGPLALAFHALMRAEGTAPGAASYVP
jgi:hypothetical protein